MVVDGACFLVVLIGRLGCHGAGLVGMLNEVSVAVEHKFGPPAVQCKSQATPDLPEEDGLDAAPCSLSHIFFWVCVCVFFF